MRPQENPRPGVAGLVDVVDRLRSPGGCPWDAAQTHASLARFAIEEAFELSDAIAGDNRDDLVDELGDLLFQVVFHARLGQEHRDPFDIDEVADRIVAKLRRRHPHVFGDVKATSTEAIEANWDAIKAAENPDRTSPLDGIPAGLPPLERAAKIAGRYARAGRTDRLRRATLSIAATGTGTGMATEASIDEDGTAGADHIGARLLVLAIDAVEAGVDPGTALTHTLARLESALRDSEDDDSAR